MKNTDSWVSEYVGLMDNEQKVASTIGHINSLVSTDEELIEIGMDALVCAHIENGEYESLEDCRLDFVVKAMQGFDRNSFMFDGPSEF